MFGGLKREGGFWWSVLGGVASAPAVVSMAVRLLRVDLSELPAAALGVYRGLVDGLEGILLFWTTWRPSDLVSDLLIVHLVFLVAAIRAEVLVKGPLFFHWQRQAEHYRVGFSRGEKQERVHLFIGLFVPLYLFGYFIWRHVRFGDVRERVQAAAGWILETGASEERKRDEFQLEFGRFTDLRDRYRTTARNAVVGIGMALAATIAFLVLNGVAELAA